jgi:PAS domain S-box-containing protein
MKSIEKKSGAGPMADDHFLQDEARLAGVLNDASIDQILAFDTNLAVIAWNKACELVTGIAKADAMGKSFNEVRAGAVDYPYIREAIENALKGFKSFVPWNNGSYGDGYFENHFIPLKDKDDNVISVLNIIHDVAHRIKAERELQTLNNALTQKNRELKQKTEELANFNWIASHDLKEPLRKIYTFIELVATKEGEKLSNAARSNLRRAQSAVQRIGLLTDDIVTFSKVTAPDEQLEVVDLREALAYAHAEHSRIISETNAVIESDPLPSIMSFPKMQQYLWYHMVGNSLKFHKPDEAPKVNISYRRLQGKDTGSQDASDEDWYHCISFKDDGIGFDPVYSDKVFEMFQRLDNKEHYKGTGMGLAICKKVAEAHDGFITVKSEAGNGAEFSCYLKDLSVL